MFQSSRGVTTPANQGSPANEGTANTVVDVMEAKFVVVKYYDGQGRLTSDVLLEAGGNYYTPPNSAAWAASLKSVRSWLADGIRKKLPRGNVKVNDSVEILPGE